MTPVAISSGGALDLPTIMPVMRCAFDSGYGEAWSEAQCLGVLAMPGSGLTIATADRVVGFALARTIADECELMLLAVDPRLRRQGIGRDLLDTVIALARDQRAKQMFLEMRSGNTAFSLYCSRGFQEVGRRRHYYRGASGQVFDAVTCRLALS